MAHLFDMKKKIALIAGGYTGEYVISVKTAVTIEKNIDPSVYDVYKIIIDRKGWLHTRPNGDVIEVDRRDFSLHIDGQHILFDACFIAVHGTPGEDGKLQGYLEMLGIPFTSCNAIVSGVTFNKIFCNRIIAQSGVVHVSPSLHIIRERALSDEAILQQLNLPVFVKPAEGGSSLATTKVKTPETLRAALDAVFAFDSQAMVEAFVKGREFSIGVYRNKLGHVQALPLTEIISSKEFFDYEAKYTDGVTREVTPAEVPESLSQTIAQKACTIYDILNCKGICRIDFIVEDTTGDIYFLEINTVPGQSENSIVPQQVKASGSTLMEFYGEILATCLAE